MIGWPVRAIASHSRAESSSSGAVAGGEDDGVVGLARRRRDAGQRRAGQARGEAGHDAEADAGARQRQRLLAAASEDERIAALEAHAPCLLSRASAISRSLMSV